MTCKSTFVTSKLSKKRVSVFVVCGSGGRARVREEGKGAVASRQRKRKDEVEKKGQKPTFRKLRREKEGGKRETLFLFATMPFAVALRATTSSARLTVTSAVSRPGRQQRMHAARRPPAFVPTPAPSSMGGRRHRMQIGRRTPPLLSSPLLPPSSSTGGGEQVFGPGTGRLPREELAGPIEILRQASVDLRAAGSSAIEAFRRRNDVVVDGDEAKSEAAKKGSAMGNSKFLPMVML